MHKNRIFIKKVEICLGLKVCLHWQYVGSINNPAEIHSNKKYSLQNTSPYTIHSCITKIMFIIISLYCSRCFTSGQLFLEVWNSLTGSIKNGSFDVYMLYTNANRSFLAGISDLFGFNKFYSLCFRSILQKIKPESFETTRDPQSKDPGKRPNEANFPHNACTRTAYFRNK